MGRILDPLGRGGAAALLAAFALTTSAVAGPAQDYMLYCMGCHGVQAEGVAGKVPPLAGAVARFMRAPEGRDYVLRVPGAANSALADSQLAALLNWLAERYPAPEQARVDPFTAEEVARTRHIPLANVQARRREVIRSLSASGPAPAAEY